MIDLSLEDLRIIEHLLWNPTKPGDWPVDLMNKLESKIEAGIKELKPKGIKGDWYTDGIQTGWDCDEYMIQEADLGKEIVFQPTIGGKPRIDMEEEELKPEPKRSTSDWADEDDDMNDMG